MSDPRAPVLFLAVETDDEHYVVNQNGEIRRDARIYLSDHDMGRIRAGYVCARCYEVQETAFPEECYLCKFRMRDRQSEFVAKGYRGNIRIGPSTSLEDEEAFMTEWAQIEAKKNRDPITRPSQVWLPGKGI